MRSGFFSILTAIFLLITACSPSSREQNERRTAEAKRKADAAAQRLRQDARHLGNDIHQALTNTGSGTGPTHSAEEKLRRGGEDLRAASQKAGVKLGHAATIAEVKAKLATATGLSTVTSINVSVDPTGHIVTLHGRVDSEAQKERAAEVAGEVSGVERVINQLSVQP